MSSIIVDIWFTIRAADDPLTVVFNLSRYYVRSVEEIYEGDSIKFSISFLS